MSRKAAYIPERGDAVWITLDPQAGHEQAGRRPALVLSPSAYNGRVGLALCCPITSQVKGYPFEVPLPVGSPVSGVVGADQVKSLDWRAQKRHESVQSLRTSSLRCCSASGGCFQKSGRQVARRNVSVERRTVTFAHPELLWALMILPGLVLWAISGRSRRARDWRALLAQRGRVPRDGTVLLIGCAACLIVAMAQPRWGRLAAPPVPPGHDVVLMVDVSRSMGVEDAVPNRLAAAIEAAESLVNALASEPVQPGGCRSRSPGRR